MKMNSSEEYPEDLQRSLTYALRLLGFRPRTEKEIKEKLQKKDFQEKIILQTIDLLKQDKLLGDAEFAKWWVEQRSEFRPKGNIILKQELLQKGVSREILDEVIEEASGEEAAARKLADKHVKKFGNLKNRENFQKAARFFQRRGFSWDIIKKILKE